jgi:GxxExxY protein
MLVSMAEDAMEESDPLTQRIIGCGIEVHRQLGPGLLESTYERAMCIELEFVGLSFECEKIYPVDYRGVRIGFHQPDLIVENEVVVEIKCAANYDPVFTAQVLTYLRVTGIRKGLLLNFNRPVLKDGVKRFVL